VAAGAKTERALSEIPAFPVLRPGRDKRWSLRRSDTDLRAPNAKIQLKGDRCRSDILRDIDHSVLAIFAGRPTSLGRLVILFLKVIALMLYQAAHGESLQQLFCAINCLVQPLDCTPVARNDSVLRFCHLMPAFERPGTRAV
jgi:hypothetical protein